eukprot:scaffold461_cov321-Pavlova_lutheri.AAC.1
MAVGPPRPPSTGFDLVPPSDTEPKTWGGDMGVGRRIGSDRKGTGIGVDRGKEPGGHTLLETIPVPWVDGTSGLGGRPCPTERERERGRGAWKRLKNDPTEG